MGEFRVFLRQVWDHLGLPPPTRIQNDIARTLQYGSHKQIIQAFRGVGKSWITTVFVLWLLFLNPQLKVMVVSAGQGLADDITKFAKQLITGMPLLQHLAPKPGQLDQNIKFDVGPAKPSKDPSFKSVGITGQLTGSRADVIVGDDVEVPKNSFTRLLRLKISSLSTEFNDVLKPGGRIIYLGTPQVEESLYVELLKRGYTVTIWPAEIPEKPEKYKGRLGPHIQALIDAGYPPGYPTEDTRFGEIELVARKLEKGATGYALQYMLDTSLSDIDRKPLKCRNLIVMDVDADQGFVKLVWSSERDSVISDLSCGGLDSDYYVRPSWRSEEMQKWQGTVMAIDPSGRGKDETAFAIIRYLYGTLYLVKCKGYLDGFGEETLKDIAKHAVEFRCTDIIIEENFGGGMFGQLLKPHVIKTAQEMRDPRTGEKGLPIPRFDEEWDAWSSTQKEIRICDVLEPVLGSHKLVVDRAVILEDLEVQSEKSDYSLIQQMTRLERLKGALAHEDRLEAVSMACAYWTERMDRDKDKMLAKHQEELLDKELQAFGSHIHSRNHSRLQMGSPSSTPRSLISR